MTDQQDGMKSMEAKHLSEGLSLIREDLREIRTELRAGLEGRPTHSDLGALKALTEKQIELISQRMQQDKEAHVVAMENLRNEQKRLELKLQEIQNDTKKTQEQKDKLQRNVIAGFLATLGGLVATNVWQGFIG